jgi:hypothetical protein
MLRVVLPLAEQRLRYVRTGGSSSYLVIFRRSD